VTDLAVLLAPSTNRVYGAEAPRLALAELALVAPRLEGTIGTASTKVVAGVEYLWLEDAGGLNAADCFVLSNLSSTFALFEVEGDGAFRPRAVTPLAFYDSDLLSIQRYAGRTNEQFTHLLVNVALAASSAAAERAAGGLPVRLLDPLAGRGTTLNRGLVYGFDVAGVEVDGRDVDAYRAFLTTYLRDHRRRVVTEEAAVRKGQLAGTKRSSMTIGNGQRVELVRGDTCQSAQFFAARSFDVLVADLPYGVQHGASAHGHWARSPTELVAAAIGGWREVLRGGGAMALSFNLKTCPREAVEGTLVDAGLWVLDAAALDHRVDRAVQRAVVVATK
jgi:hypothetical protein